VEERDDERVVCVDVVVDAVGEPLEKDTAHELFLVTERESARSPRYDWSNFLLRTGTGATDALLASPTTAMSLTSVSSSKSG